MKKLLLLVTVLISAAVSAQNYNMPSGTNTISTCSGNFYDSGGPGSDYGSLQDRVYTICPSTPGAKIRVNFSAFDLQNNTDYLYIFDGTTTGAPSLGVYTGTTSPGIVQATVSNASGCLTFRFTSNLTNNQPGWAGVISCISPCQTINSSITSSTPAAGAGGIIRICQGQNVSFTGSGTFSSSSAGATYSWNFGDGTSANGINVNHTYSTAGGYLVNLTITDPSSCTSTNLNNQVVQVSTTPTINTSATPSTLCTNQFSALNAAVTMNTFTSNCTPPVSGTTFLPDGTGVSYTTSITADCYAPGATITSANDFINLCLNIEHSFLGDLSIRFICPNGQSMVLKAYPGGSGTYLGSPLDDPAVGPGTGTTYCFTPSASTLLISGTTTTAGSPAGSSIVAGDYQPVQPFSNMIGCPLNGSWTIEVTDNLGIDNGYIFNWDFNLTAALNLVPAFTPTIVSQGWVANPTLYPVNSTQANALPTAMGVQCYTYSVTDNFGCTYTAPQCINVNCMSLPVGLVSFDAKPVENSRVELSWVTESEEDNDRFEVDRSLDGENWEKIYVTSGAGDSQEELHYEAVDPSPYRGISYYRLRQIDTDGTERVSDIDVVNLSADGLVIYPNPANEFLVLEGNTAELADFQLLDALGKDVKAQVPVSKIYDAKLELDLSNLAKGTYMIKTTTATYLIVKQ